MSPCAPATRNSRVSFLFSPRSGINPLGDAKIAVLHGHGRRDVLFLLRSGIIFPSPTPKLQCCAVRSFVLRSMGEVDSTAVVGLKLQCGLIFVHRIWTLQLEYLSLVLQGSRWKRDSEWARAEFGLLGVATKRGCDVLLCQNGSSDSMNSWGLRHDLHNYIYPSAFAPQ